MCSAYNEPSFNERVQCYIIRKEEIEVEYKSKMKALNEEASADIIANCPIIKLLNLMLMLMVQLLLMVINVN